LQSKEKIQEKARQRETKKEKLQHAPNWDRKCRWQDKRGFT